MFLFLLRRDDLFPRDPCLWDIYISLLHSFKPFAHELEAEEMMHNKAKDYERGKRAVTSSRGRMRARAKCFYQVKEANSIQRTVLSPWWGRNENFCAVGSLAINSVKRTLHSFSTSHYFSVRGNTTYSEVWSQIFIFFLITLLHMLLYFPSLILIIFSPSSFKIYQYLFLKFA